MRFLRCCDANERVHEKAEDTLEAMVVNEKVQNAGELFELFLQPLLVSCCYLYSQYYLMDY